MLDYIYSNTYLIALAIVVGSFLLTYIIIPKIIWIVHSRELIDHPDERSSHKVSTPTMAGVSFFLTLVLTILALERWDFDSIGIEFIASITLIFMLGLKDDLVLVTPRGKIIIQLLAITILFSSPALNISTLNGFLGIHNVPVYIMYPFLYLLFLTMINSYNLIDGIDGLASVIGIVIFIVFGFIFYLIDQPFYAFFSLALIGILVAYLFYNFSSSQKIFMGDTGSLIIGFCIGFLTLKFLSIDASALESLSFKPENKFILIGTLFSVPLFDTIRVIGVRLLNGNSPFYPDRNHFHHLLVDNGLRHATSSLFLAASNLFFITLFIGLCQVYGSWTLLVCLILGFALYIFIAYKFKQNIERKNRTTYLFNALKFIDS